MTAVIRPGLCSELARLYSTAAACCWYNAANRRSPVTGLFQEAEWRRANAWKTPSSVR